MPNIQLQWLGRKKHSKVREINLSLKQQDRRNTGNNSRQHKYSQYIAVSSCIFYVVSQLAQRKSEIKEGNSDLTKKA